MTINTTSDLNRVDTLNDDDLFRVSQRLNDGYASRKCEYKQLEDMVVTASIVSAESEWGLSNFNGEDIAARVKKFEDAIRIDASPDSVGKAVFQNPPASLGRCVLSTDIPNIQEVVELIYDNSEYVSPGSYVEADPNNSSGNGTAYLENPHQYHWHIDAGMMDSSSAEDIESARGKNGGVLIQDTGLLTVYGWVASNADILAQEAWIGLFGMTQTKDRTGQPVSKWVLLQVQPFVVGKYAQAAQYVGFNLPVKAGAELKIMTGFKVNGSASGLHVGNSLMFNGRGNMPNHFVGYVLMNK